MTRTRAGVSRFFGGGVGGRSGRAASAAVLAIGSVAFAVAPAGGQSADPWVQIGSDIDGEAPGDFSGESVSLSADGTTVAVGAIFNNNAAGHVRVYRQANGAWAQVGADIDGESNGDLSGASVSLSADGNTVAIGAPNNSSNSGHVRVFSLINGAWVQLGADIDGQAPDEQSGRSVSLSVDGAVVAIGAPNDDFGAGDGGRTRIYEFVNGSWAQVGADIDGEATGDASGQSVSLSGDGAIVAIGAWGNDGNGDRSGHVRVYELLNGSWAQVGADIDGESSGDNSGRVSLSAAGDRVAVGAPVNDGGGASAGHVRVFDLVGGSWAQVGADIDGEAAGELSGWSVSLAGDGDRVAVGSLADSSNAGHARIFELINDSWVQVGADIEGEAVGDRFGGEVSLSADGSSVAIGASSNDGGGDASGHVRMFGEPVSCGGLSVTVDLGAGDVPTVGDDVILGTAGPDVINALDGDDVVCAEGGDDLVIGGGGDDVIFGGPGEDTISGNAGADQLFGEGGSDSIFGGSGDDKVDGGIGNDRALGGSSGSDTVLGGDGRDTLSGGSDGDALVSGGEGDDAVNGGGGNDSDVRGDAGDDTVSGNGGRDVVRGGDGDDQVRGGQNDDQVFGDGGDDFLAGNGGEDACDGGTTGETNGDVAASNCETVINVP